MVNNYGLNVDVFNKNVAGEWSPSITYTLGDRKTLLVAGRRCNYGVLGLTPMEVAATPDTDLEKETIDNNLELRFTSLESIDALMTVLRATRETMVGVGIV